MLKKVLILNHNGNVVFDGKARCTNFERDPETDCKIAKCHLEQGLIVRVWEIDGKWQGWL